MLVYVPSSHIWPKGQTSTIASLVKDQQAPRHADGNADCQLHKTSYELSIVEPNPIYSLHVQLGLYDWPRRYYIGQHLSPDPEGCKRTQEAFRRGE